MSATSKGMKNLIVVILLVGGAAAGFGYFRQTSDLREDANATTPAAVTPDGNPPPVDSRAKQRQEMQEQQALLNAKPAAPNDPIFSVRKDDILLGQPNAPVTIVEYASLSCPHCAHFYENVLPDLKKEFVDTGKVKFVYRHFPLNEPALRAAQLVDCADKGQKETFVKVLYNMQKNWAYTQDFIAGLKQIALVGGMDAARFDSCIADKKGEEHVLAMRQEAAKVALVNATPTLFVNGVAVQGEATADAMRNAIKGAKPAAPAKK